MILERRLRFFLLVCIGIIFLIGVYFADAYLTGTKGLEVEAIPSLDSYTVKIGDSLFSIARKYGVSAIDIKEVNHLSSDAITPGQVLSIPNKPATNWYTVKSGDSLYYIAMKYGVTIAALQRANTLSSSVIIPGQILVIPERSSNTNQILPVASQPKPEPVNPPTKQIPTPQAPVEQKAVAKTLTDIFKDKGISNPWSQMVIIVDKSDHTLSLYANSIWLRSYHVELGDGGLGDKVIQGDHKTPEGTFYIAEKSVLNPVDEFLGTRWMRLSYPNIEDADRGLQQGLIDQWTHDQIVTAFNNKGIPPQYSTLGGGVGIHGGSRAELGHDWTWGCVGLQDRDVEDFFDYVTVGTPVIIQK